jgi:hypothetical protein
MLALTTITDNRENTVRRFQLRFFAAGHQGHPFTEVDVGAAGWPTKSVLVFHVLDNSAQQFPQSYYTVYTC